MCINPGRLVARYIKFSRVLHIFYTCGPSVYALTSCCIADI